MIDAAEIALLRAENAVLLSVLRAIDMAAAEIEATDAPADDRALWSSVYEARRLLGAGSSNDQDCQKKAIK